SRRALERVDDRDRLSRAVFSGIEQRLDAVGPADLSRAIARRELYPCAAPNGGRWAATALERMRPEPTRRVHGKCRLHEGQARDRERCDDLGVGEGGTR